MNKYGSESQRRTFNVHTYAYPVYLIYLLLRIGWYGFIRIWISLASFNDERRNMKIQINRSTKSFFVCKNIFNVRFEVGIGKNLSSLKLIQEKCAQELIMTFCATS